MLVQKPQRHDRRGPPKLQIRAPNRNSEDRRQEDIKRREEAADEEHQEQSPPRTVVRYREPQTRV